MKQTNSKDKNWSKSVLGIPIEFKDEKEDKLLFSKA